MEFNKLTPKEENIIVNKGTEAPFSGEFNKFFKEGIYICRRCNAPLYKSSSKFDAHCGWPSFDDEVKGSVRRIPDKDGMRTEVVCANCGAHLGHVFEGEKYTSKNIRHCINSISMKFILKGDQMPDVITPDVAIFGGGCFWCMEAVFSCLKGVISTEVGYAGGHMENPTYEDVFMGKTGHAEVVKIRFDEKIISYGKLLEIFFHSHNPTTLNYQGSDIGEQYRSIILCTTNEQKEEAKNYIRKLELGKEFSKPIVTKVVQLDKFYPAEISQQEYYKKNPNKAYCQIVISPKILKLKEKYGNLLKSEGI